MLKGSLLVPLGEAIKLLGLKTVLVQTSLKKKKLDVHDSGCHVWAGIIPGLVHGSCNSVMCNFSVFGWYPAASCT